ncbi:formate dehydrogenase accessory protein FdhE [Acetobacter farinalis]|uniref:Formate dehydrogenase accessory protein FdhE n=1 Tax=Acetobacter farinalis TaxID=1260984 RepID=A0ABT3Q7S1_9PROT|nr:formate dehydrogenase accessory protein FdhE [Acetobacter farinalis]MCX2561342.1 formate dehydrogenase accessory protein FdhE [Acetobacter farinalis]
MMKDQSDIPSLDKRIPGVPAIEPLIFPKLAALYARRSARLEALASRLVTDAAEDESSSAPAGEEQAGYFSFLAGLVAAQRRLLEESPLSLAQAEPVRVLLQGTKASPEVPSRQMLAEAVYWQDAFARLVAEAGVHLPPETRAGLDALVSDTSGALAEQAFLLLSGQYDRVDAGAAVFLWSALSVYWAQAIALLARETGELLHNRRSEGGACPCCGAPPSGALVLTGDREGLRYLQCSLCETRWHKVRATCSVCDATDHIDYWSFESTDAPIQGETCGDCHSYVKLFRLDRDPELEVSADDLASVALDSALEDQGFIRATLNPFSFPA